MSNKIRFALSPQELEGLVKILSKSRVIPENVVSRPYSLQNKEFEEAKSDYLTFFKNHLNTSNKESGVLEPLGG